MEYENFKNLVVGQNLLWFYRQNAKGYAFITYIGPLTFNADIYFEACTPDGASSTQAAVDDFEANHKASAINIS